MTDFLQRATTIRAITYKNAMSAEHSSYNDLILGHIHGKVGCNSKVFGSDATKEGAIVLIMAEEKRKRYFTFGVLGERLPSCSLWKDHGGQEWLYNFSYTPLLPVLEITSDMEKDVYEFAEKHQCNAKNFFHGRFCSVLLKPIFVELYQKLAPQVAVSVAVA